MRNIVLIDISGIIHRAYHSRPIDKFRLSSGLSTNAIHGTCSILLNLFVSLNSNSPDSTFFIACLDKGCKERKMIDETYKANRSKTPSELTPQFSIIYDIIDKMGIAQASLNGHEADDVIASLAHRYSMNGDNVIIISSDKDMYQLLDIKNVVIFDTYKKKWIREADVSFMFGIPSKHMILYQALVGDSCDNVKGVKGIGPKTASRIINEFNGNEDAIIEYLYHKKNKTEVSNFQLSKKLVTLNKELAISDDDTSNFSKAKLQFNNELYTLLGSLELNSIIKMAKHNESNLLNLV